MHNNKGRAKAELNILIEADVRHYCRDRGMADGLNAEAQLRQVTPVLDCLTLIHYFVELHATAC